MMGKTWVEKCRSRKAKVVPNALTTYNREYDQLNWVTHFAEICEPAIYSKLSLKIISNDVT